MQKSWPRPVRRVVRGARNRVSALASVGAGTRHRLARTVGTVALTFDDGPDPEFTPAVLDELARLGVVGTFFVVGRRSAAHPQVVRRIVAEGHALGSHSDSHPDPWQVSLPDLVREYRLGRSKAESATGESVPLFRPPKGHISARGMIAMRAARVRPWLWTIDPGDWRPGMCSSDIVAGVVGLGEGDVVLLHDAIESPLDASTLDRTATLGALADIVGLAHSRGLRFTTLN